MSGQQPFVVIASLTASAGQGDRLLEGLRQHAHNCVTNEAGCLAFDVTRDSVNPDLFIAYEVYRDADGFEAHKASDHFAWFRETYGGLIADRDLKLMHAVEGRLSRKAASKILVTAKPLHRYPQVLEPLVDAGYVLEMHEGAPLRSEGAVIAALEGVVATVASVEPYNDTVFADSPSLRVVARMGVGFDQIDVDAATRHGVAVAMTFGANHDAVADHTFAMMASVVQKLRLYDNDVREGRWGTRFHGSLAGMTAGVVGFGRIGRAFAKRCQGFNMRILVADPLVDAATVSRLGAELVELDDLMAASDIVSIHSPLNEATRHLINARRLGLMRNHAVIVNTARGPIIDEAALVEALQAGTIGGAALDVFEKEPLLESPLKTMDNVLLAPHVAGLSEQAIKSMGRRCVSNILTILEGRDPGGGLLLNPQVLGRADAPGGN